MAYVSVEVDLSDFDTDELVDELASRKVSGMDAGSVAAAFFELPPLNSEDVHPLHRVYYRLKLGDECGALDEIRTYLQDQLGVVL